MKHVLKPIAFTIPQNLVKLALRINIWISLILIPNSQFRLQDISINIFYIWLVSKNKTAYIRMCMILLNYYQTLIYGFLNISINKF